MNNAADGDNNKESSHLYHQALSWDYGDNAASPLDEEEEEYVRLPEPSEDEMARRREYRNNVAVETTQHRLNHVRDGMGGIGRNIAFALRDRERFGVRRVTPYIRPNRSVIPKLANDCAPSPTAVKDTAKVNGEEATPVDDSMGDDVDSGSCGLPNMMLPSRVSYPMNIFHEIQTFAEHYSVTNFESTFFHHLGGDDELDENGNKPASSAAVSTISIAFSPDSQTMASTHGDHTVKITSCATGALLESLEGHPRTPWTVKYHPKNPSMLASGCLGHQVRVWDWKKNACIYMIRLEFAIISLSFHPEGDILAIANGTRLHFWGYATRQHQQNTDNSRSYREPITEVEQRHMLRCVHFPPCGKAIIVGGVNPTDDPRRRGLGGVSGGGMSFYLRLWDFDADAALRPIRDGSTIGLRRRPISNPRTFVPRALLYNDGGFDISPDGKILCACAEYWLPDGINNAMEWLRHEEVIEDDLEPGDSGQGGGDSSSSSDPNNPSGPGGADRSLSPRHGSRTPTHATYASPTPPAELTPRTPPNPSRPHFTLSPPSPPGRRLAGGLVQGRRGNRPSSGAPYPFPDSERIARPTNVQVSSSSSSSSTTSTAPGMSYRAPHPLSMMYGIVGGKNGNPRMEAAQQKGRFVPHVVTVSLDTTPVTQVEGGSLTPGRGKLVPVARGYRPRLGQLLEACPLDGAKASAVTCVKFSPSTDFCLIGFGVREPVNADTAAGNQFHPVTALYRVRGGMKHMSTMLSGDDDVNIARFHPDSGHGFVYGTKQGRVRVLSPRPWNYYNC